MQFWVRYAHEGIEHTVTDSSLHALALAKYVPAQIHSRLAACTGWCALHSHGVKQEQHLSRSLSQPARGLYVSP